MKSYIFLVAFVVILYYISLIFQMNPMGGRTRPRKSPMPRKLNLKAPGLVRNLEAIFAALDLECDHGPVALEERPAAKSLEVVQGPVTRSRAAASREAAAKPEVVGGGGSGEEEEAGHGEGEGWTPSRRLSVSLFGGSRSSSSSGEEVSSPQRRGSGRGELC